jgi:AcrR family transcriptional regulator
MSVGTADASGQLTRAEAIRDAALTLFAERGFRATTMKDVASAVGVRAPSLYNHVRSKDELLTEIMVTTMDELIHGFHRAVATTCDPVEQLRRATEAHVRYHTRHRREAFVGNREIPSLKPGARRMIVNRRREYSMLFRDLIDRGSKEGVFLLSSPRLVAYAILDMGIGLAAWFRPDGPYTEEELAQSYGKFALRLACRGPSSHVPGRELGHECPPRA